MRPSYIWLTVYCGRVNLLVESIFLRVGALLFHVHCRLGRVSLLGFYFLVVDISGLGEMGPACFESSFTDYATNSIVSIDLCPFVFSVPNMKLLFF